MRAFVVTCSAVGILLAACGGGFETSGPGSGTTYSTEPKSGLATFYDADGTGSCSFDPSPDDLDVVALNTGDFAGSAACGGCLRVTGPKGSVTVRVVDSCPPCGRNHLDLSEQAFAEIADKIDGRVEISYQAAACAVSGPLAYRFKEGSTRWWTAIQVRNHSVPIAKLEYQRSGAWREMKREGYNYFVDGEGVGDTPGGLRLRLTAADGRVVEDAVPGVEAGRTVRGTAEL